jgi:lipoprotein-anchoring transpeptidase ErfK/SrfK
MQRICASAPVAFSIAACALPLLITDASAAGQLLDPGWQIVYAGQPSYSGGGGLIESMFGDGPGQPVVAYQPAPMYYPPAPQMRGYQAAPAYYQQVPAPQMRAYQPAPVYYQQVPARQPRAYQPAPVYYQQVPVPQPRAYQPAQVYYRQMPAPQPRAYQPAPVSYQQVPAPQPPAYQAAPQYTGSVLPPQNAPQSSPTPQHSFFQLTPPQQRATAQPTPQPTPPQQSAAQPPPQQSAAQLTPAPAPAPQQSAAQPPPQPEQPPPAPHRSFFQLTPPPPQAVAYAQPAPSYPPSEYGDVAQPMVDPKYDRQVVDYRGDEQPGTIVIDTPHYFLYLVMEGGKAMRYGIGVGRPGFTWAGVKEISAMREWPDWIPPADMIQRQPDLPRYMAGGPGNPLGARALYLGSTLYRIHGSNEPWTIGTPVSSGCIRLRNADVIDLYGRVKVGNKVAVI